MVLVLPNNLSRVKFHEGDTLVLWADDSFISTWGDSSVFVLLANGKDTEPKGDRKKTLVCIDFVGGRRLALYRIPDSDCDWDYHTVL